ncbi:FAD-dependent oxidoreductase [Pelosinus sp. UFO1]|uniref:FAD-dependent oxidoreductase n=1 Tax=Pelosinus sp. UFO1 TaxID=484770 RepID=UPI003529B2D7
MKGTNMAKKVVIVGAGWAGCAAALAARKMGCDVELFERTDMLLGTGLVGGIMRNNGRFTATEEMIAMGGGDLFIIADEHARHKNIEFPGHYHANLYDVATIEPAVRTELANVGVKIHFKTRVTDIETNHGVITKIVADQLHGDTVTVEGAAFVDGSGTAGPIKNCIKYGNGCAMCIYRCPTFGPRFSIAAKAGIKEIISIKPDGTLGAMSGSCKLHKDSLGLHLKKELDSKGVCVIPIPAHLQKSLASLGQKACQQYASQEFVENIVLLDTGHAKLMTAYYPLEILRQITGLENARFEDPYAGGIGNSMRYFGMLPRDNYLQVNGLQNVFCCGEKAGLLVGHTEAIVTGTLAGYNAARYTRATDLLAIPTSLACGDAIAHVRAEMETPEGLANKYTFSGSVYFERMKNRHLYTTDIEEIKLRVRQAQMTDIFAASQ